MNAHQLQSTTFLKELVGYYIDRAIRAAQPARDRYWALMRATQAELERAEQRDTYFVSQGVS